MYHSFQKFPDISSRDPNLARKPFFQLHGKGNICAMRLLGSSFQKYLGFTGCVLFDCMMSQDGFEMALAS